MFLNERFLNNQNNFSIKFEAQVILLLKMKIFIMLQTSCIIIFSEMLRTVNESQEVFFKIKIKI